MSTTSSKSTWKNKIQEFNSSEKPNTNKIGSIIMLLGTVCIMIPTFFQYESLPLADFIGKRQCQYLGVMISFLGATIFNRKIAIIFMTIAVISYIIVFLV